MKICKKCKKEFNSTAIIDGDRKSLTSRSYCLDCSPFGKLAGYDLRKANTAIVSSGIRYKTCKCCPRVFKWTKNSVCSTCRSYHLRHKRRHKAIEILGGKCLQCGIDDEDVLTFHHRNREDKSFTLCLAWGTKSWEELEKEVSKCDLLCCNCHQKFHVMERRRDGGIGETQGT